MTTINVDGSTFDVLPDAPSEHAAPLRRAAGGFLERDAVNASETCQPDDASTVAEDDVAHVVVPPVESHARSGWPADGSYVTHPSVPVSLSHPVVDEQQQGCHILEMVEEGIEERLAEPTSFEAGEIMVQADEAVEEDATTNLDETEPMIGARVDAAEIHIESVTSPARSPAEVEAAVPERGGKPPVSSPLAVSEENGVPAASVGVVEVPRSGERLARESDSVLATAAPVEEPPQSTRIATPVATDSQAWVVDFGTGRPKAKRKMTKKEKDAIKESRLRSQSSSAAIVNITRKGSNAVGGLGADSEGNAVMVAHDAAAALQVVHLDGLADRAAQIPTNLATTRADLEQRLVLRLPRLLCVNKQYPRGCGIASLTSVYNYLYSWLGESEVGAQRPPHSQEEIMSILGFEPPFGEIAWGPFTGNATLIRWFHALNRHFGHRGKAYILYKAHGHGKTTHIYPDNAAALVAVKAALRDPHCALIYHCHNHYMVPVGYQEIPHAQTDFFKPDVPESNCDTTIFVGEVSRGRHEAMYARKWAQIVKDIECKSPYYFNIRHPEQGVQKREPKKKTVENAEFTTEPTQPPPPQDGADVEVVAVIPSTQTTTPPTLLIPMPRSLRGAEANASAQQERTGTEGVIGDAVLVAVSKEGKEEQGHAHVPVVHAEEESVRTAPNAETTTQDTVKTSSTPAAYVVVESSPSSSSSSPSSSPVERGGAGADNVAGAARTDTRVEEEPTAAMTHSQSSKGSASPKPAGVDVPPPNAPADIAAEGVDDAEPAEPHASPVANAEACYAAAAQATSSQPPPSVEAEPDTTANNAAAPPPPLPVIAHLPSSLTAHAAPRTNTRLLSPNNVAAAPQQAPPLATTKPKKERGNLHCLIIFRNDQVEEQLERYEDAAVEGQITAKTAALSSASSGDASTSSDEDEG